MRSRPLNGANRHGERLGKRGDLGPEVVAVRHTQVGRHQHLLGEAAVGLLAERCELGAEGVGAVQAPEATAARHVSLDRDPRPRLEGDAFTALLDDPDRFVA